MHFFSFIINTIAGTCQNYSYLALAPHGFDKHSSTSRRHSTLGFPTMPGGQVHSALWFDTEHCALLPQVPRLAQGFSHLPLLHHLFGAQSPWPLQPALTQP